MLREITKQQWLALFAAQSGYMLDAMDVLLYVFAVNTLRAEFHLSNSEAGFVSSVTLICSAVGGIACGMLADCVGRTRTLVYTILVYSLASGGTALSTGYLSLLFWRGLVGIGLGGQWSAGAVLVAETWPAKHRAKAIGFMQAGWALGYMLAAGVTALVLPRFGWRALFLTGLFPALVAIAIRRGVAEPEVWARVKRVPSPLSDLFAPALLRRTVLATALTTSVLFAYWGLFTWLPGFLSAAKSAGGAGMSILKTSAWVVPVQMGAFLGYVSFGWIADRFGKRLTFVTYMVAAAALVPVYGMNRSETELLWLGPFVGFFGSGVLQFVRRDAGGIVSDKHTGHGTGVHVQLRARIERACAAGGGEACRRVWDRGGFGGEFRLFSLGSGAYFYAAGLSATG